MPNSMYQYEPKDREYLDKNELVGFTYYDELLQKSVDLGQNSAVDGIVEAYRIGGSLRKGGALLSRSDVFMVKHLKRMGVKLNPKGGYHDREPAPTRIGTMCKNGHTERYLKSKKCRPCHIEYMRRRYLEKQSTRR